MAKEKSSGLEKIPQIISRPFYKDRFVWWGLATAVFWILLFWWLFF